MLESTEAFKRFANGKSWNQLDFKVQQQIRLAAILEQTYARYGDTLADTTQTKQAKFIASLEDIKLNLGQAFLPIYNVVLPALTALAEKLENITAHFAAVSQTVFGKATKTTVASIEEQTQAIVEQGDAIETAGKQAKGAIAPFDEINKVNVGVDADQTSGGTSSIIKPVVNTEVVETNNSFTQSINKLKDVIQPTVDALGRLKDALKPIGNFVFDNIKNFYNDALKPIGTWVLGEGLPRLLDVGTGLLKSINWEKLTDALKNLYQALAPFAISVGRGLIIFIETMAEILKPIIATTADLLAKAINAIAKAIKAIPEKVAVAIGGAIGGIVTAILMFKGATTVITTIKSIKVAFNGLLGVLSVHPLMALAAGIGALAGAAIALDKAKFDSSNLGKYIASIKQLTDRAKEYNEQVDKMLEEHEQKKQSIEAEYGAISILADKYFDLADKQELTNSEQALLKAYAEELIEKIPELSELIDGQTGAYKGTKEEIESLIGKTKEYYLVQAAQKSLIEIAKKQYEGTKQLKELEEEHSGIVELLNQKRAEYESIAKAGAGADRSASEEQKKAALQAINLSTEISRLERSQKELKKQIDETKKSQNKLSKEWDYATNYITTYSTNVQESMKKVENSVSTALENVKTKVKNFKLPDITAKVVLDTAGIKSTGIEFLDAQKSMIATKIKGYASGGFPSAGELFLANEDGPELIGRFGNRAAVANTDQIVEGIARGVANANAEEVDLLRQQNNLLQAILQKTGITTKSIYDAVVTENRSQIKRGRRPLLE